MKEACASIYKILFDTLHLLRERERAEGRERGKGREKKRGRGGKGGEEGGG